MGTIENKEYENIFKTPKNDETTLRIYMLKEILNKELFELEVKNSKVKDISIHLPHLEYEKFERLINEIKYTTNKPLSLFFLSNGDDTNIDYNEYVREYVEEHNHFPDNIFISPIVVSLDEGKNNLIKPMDGDTVIKKLKNIS